MPKKKDELDAGETTEGETPNSEAELETTPGETIEDEVVNLSAKEHKELLRQAKAATELGRTVKSLTQGHSTLKTSLDEQLKRYSELETNFNIFRQRDRETELDKYRDDKGMLDAIRLKHKYEDDNAKLARERSDYERERSQYQTELDEAAKLKAEKAATALAKESGLSAEILLQIGSDTNEKGRTTYNLERMKAIAKSVPKGEEGGEDEEQDEEKDVKTKGQRSKALTSRSGSKGLATLEDYYAAYNRGEISTAEMAKARERAGVY